MQPNQQDQGDGHDDGDGHDQGDGYDDGGDDSSDSILTTHEQE